METDNKENKYYNENIKKAIYKHRENNRPAYNERQYREKKRQENPPKARGRPRKIIPVSVPPILERIE